MKESFEVLFSNGGSLIFILKFIRTSMEKITAKFLHDHPDHVFVFGENRLRVGKGGAAALRDEPNTYGFITKKMPLRIDEAYYTPEEYRSIFEIELQQLIVAIESDPQITWLISKLGSGLANRFGIFEAVIEPGIRVLNRYSNVKLLF